MNKLEQLFAQWEQEARAHTGLKELHDWYVRRSNEVWRRYQDEVKQMVDAGRPPTAKERDEIAERTGATIRSQQLQKIYEEAVEAFMGRVAEELTDPGSDAYREVVAKYDRAWRELALR
jgi:hypothetical protein